MPQPVGVTDGSYPRPQLVRDAWTDLCGTWRFAHDDSDAGRDERWQHEESRFGRDITVPFPPESELSGVGDTGYHPVVWYRRTFRRGDVAGADAIRSAGHRLVLHLGAVDYRADVWVDGTHVGAHEGGHTPIRLDVTDALDTDADEHSVVVRAEDQPGDVAQPRGKQDWLPEPHGIWYHRTTGIWQPVWLEVVPPLAVTELSWAADVPGSRVRLSVALSRRPARPVTLAVQLRLGEEVLAEQTARVEGDRAVTDVSIPAATNGQHSARLLWSPERPTLIDAEVRLVDGDGEVLDDVASYVGLRSTAVGDGHFLLNGRPYYVRAVLEQGYWPGSHLAAPDGAALRREVELIKELGFNGARIHQKVEDPRFLHWCDRLGVLVWGEMPSTFTFTGQAVQRLTTEWMAVLRRDSSHPCVVTWVTLNESWGVQHIAGVPAQQHYATALAHLTRAVDPTRPVVSNDGWEHTDSDIWTVHDYSGTGTELTRRYGTPEAVDTVLAGRGASGRRLRLAGGAERGQPVMLTEFGGLSYAPAAGEKWFGYSTVTSPEELLDRLRDLFGAVHDATPLAGFCYTQLTDTLQETNGLLDADRRPKLPVERLRAIVTGEDR